MATWIIETNRPASGDTWEEIDRASDNVEAGRKFSDYVGSYHGTGIKVRRRRVESDEGVKYVCIVIMTDQGFDGKDTISEVYGPFLSRHSAESYGDLVTGPPNYTYNVRMISAPIGMSL
jgi:hypothetical protein